MTTPSPATLVRETFDRLCPYCSARSVVALGHVMACATEVRCDYRCLDSAQNFVLVRLNR